MAVVTRIGQAASDVWSMRAWPTSGTSLFDDRRSQAAAVKDAAQKATAPSRRKDVLVPIRSGLRGRQRDALVSRLRPIGLAPSPATPPTPSEPLLSIDSLSDYLLIDLSMSACTSTSRIKQALSSIQLFIQRASLGLEPTVTFSQTDLGPWRWMKNYRVWEANRKVFLWPENWIEPELRDDKTPFFRELEGQLLQDELTDENVETAYLTYLKQLNEVAQLEVCATCREVDPNTGADVVHVFGRTRGTPRSYYWRTRRDHAWTPWEKLELDIEGDHLLAIFHNRRLHLFWPVIERKPIMKTGTSEPTGNEYFQMRIAWTARFAGKWAPKSVSKDVAPQSWEAHYDHFVQHVSRPPESLLALQPLVLPDGDLFISVIWRAIEE